MSRLHRRESDHAAVPAAAYDIDCRRCPRLAHFLDQVLAENPGYFCRPVPPFGDMSARLVIVGLAPGMHGANASGRPFTGDYAGIMLYATLHKFGYANRAAVAERGRRPGIDRRPDHQRGQMPAAGQQAAARRDQELQRLSRRRARHRCPTAPRFSRWDESRTTPRCGRWVWDRARIHLRTAPSTLCPGRRPYGAALRLLSLQPLQHQHAAPDGGDVRAGIRVDCTLSRRRRRVLS